MVALLGECRVHIDPMSPHGHLECDEVSSSTVSVKHINGGMSWLSQ